MIAAIVLAAALAAKPSPTPVATPTPLPIAPLPVPQAQAGVPQTVTLQQAIDIAVAKSPVLASAFANYQLTQIPVEIARSAIFPNISANATISRSQNNRSSSAGGSSSGSGGTGSSGGGSIGNTFNSRGVSVDLRQLIFDGGKSIALIHQAQNNALAGSQTYQRALETLAFNVSQAYFTALQAQSTVHVDQEILKQAQTNENLTRAQVHAGTSARVDQITAHVPTVQAQVNLTRDQGALASALGAFANSIGLDPTVLVQPATTGTSNPSALLVPVLPYQQAVTRALALRPDYLSSQSAVAAAQYNVQAQRAGYLPTLNGNASVGTNSTLPNGSGFVSSNSIGATLSIPIFDQGLTRAQVQQAEQQLNLAQANAAQTRLGVELNVQQALVAVASNQAAVVQAQAAVASAQESLRGAQAQYRAGVTNLVTLLQAQTNYTQAESSLINAVYTLRQAEQQYVYAIGESSINPTSH
ncbi:MAG TPA: TolC family protein [Candidatus Baltobacteraceae bacterium]|nr:TolC family protein [Candidatus Baltobacteraceae bacterium]